MPHTRQIFGEEILADLRKLDWVRRLIAIDDLKRQLGVLERRTQCDMPANQRYLTPQWRDLKRRCLERDGHRCTTCGRQTCLRVHHTGYRTIGTDDEIKDVTTRCEACHSWAHRFTRPPARPAPRSHKNQLRISYGKSTTSPPTKPINKAA